MYRIISGILNLERVQSGVPALEPYHSMMFCGAWCAKTAVWRTRRG